MTSRVAILRGAAIILLAAACPLWVGAGPAQPSGRPDGIVVSTLSGGLVEDVPGSFAPNAKLAPGCSKAPGNPASALRPLDGEMVIVYTWRRPSGDIESILHVSPSDNGVQIVNSGEEFANDTETQGHLAAHQRTLCASDLADSSTYVTEFADDFTELLPATTTYSLSAATLHLLRTTGEAPLDYVHYDLLRPPGLWVPFQFSGILHRVEAADVQYPMIIDGKTATVTVLHAKGVFEFSGPETLREQILPERIKQQAEFYLLDDETKPISLLFKFGPLFQVQVVSIAYPKKAPQNALERQLLEGKHAVVYGIYFDFNSDRLRSESQPVLKEIADAMSHNPGWKLTIDGHTDNIGGDAKNLDLSRRRATAVQRALVEQYHLSMGRMTTSGYGASRPVDSNDTLSGRARNRRVELTRD